MSDTASPANAVTAPAAPMLKSDVRWALVWLAGIAGLAIWDLLFLNRPALARVVAGFFNTMVVAALVTLFSLAIAWATTLALHFLQKRAARPGYFIVTCALNAIRSIPQVVGVLLGYVWITNLVRGGAFSGNLAIFLLMAFLMSTFIFLEMVDLMRERIDHFQKSDFFNAMRVCGIPEFRIINFNILWKNSRTHILNKLISIFGMAVFLQCSVDFVISVGLSTQVDAVTLPPTLGSLLATIDSKQDILAIGHTLMNPGYIQNLFLGHLQGISVAFLIVFTLFCIHSIANAFAERHQI